MSQNIEYEERAMLTLYQYEKLINDFTNHKNAKHLIINNYYFDDDKLTLRNAHYMLRVRKTEDLDLDDLDYEFTLKIKGENGDIEINEPLNSDEAEQIRIFFDYPKGPIMSEVDKVIDENDLVCLTRLCCYRLEVKIDDYLLVIDKNEYSKITDYDIEIEATSKVRAKEVLLEYCNKYGFNYSINYYSKSRRAINAIKKN